MQNKLYARDPKIADCKFQGRSDTDQNGEVGKSRINLFKNMGWMINYNNFFFKSGAKLVFDR